MNVKRWELYNIKGIITPPCRLLPNTRITHPYRHPHHAWPPTLLQSHLSQQQIPCTSDTRKRDESNKMICTSTGYILPPFSNPKIAKEIQKNASSLRSRILYHSIPPIFSYLPSTTARSSRSPLPSLIPRTFLQQAPRSKHGSPASPSNTHTP